MDSMCGSGKTSWAIQNINANPDISVIYCTPFLNEIDRVRNLTNVGFVEPQYNGGRKLDDFNELIEQSENVAVSHSTFANATDETYYHLRCGEYTLYLDEELNVLMEFNEAVANKIKRGDVRMALEKKLITVDDYGCVHWIATESYPDSTFADVERMAKQGNLFCLDGKFLVWSFPVEVFETFNRIYVLTYLFEGSVLKSYFEYHGIEYELARVTQDTDGTYRLTKYSTEEEQRQEYKDLITIWDDPKGNNYIKGALNATWYKKVDGEVFKKLKNHLQRFFKNEMDAKSARILWTAKKGSDQKGEEEKYKNLLSVNGARRVRNITKEEREELSQREIEKLENRLSCFAPLNCRGTNDYEDRDVLAYLYNFYPHPNVDKFFSRKNKQDGTNIAVDKDLFALSQLIQWVWRSAIRNGKPITIYIPSTRMRTLFCRWLDGEI